jgi:hypothetical protein
MHYLLQMLGIELTGRSAIDQTMLFLIGMAESGKSTILKMLVLYIEKYFFTLNRETFSKGYSKLDKVLNFYVDRAYVRISFMNGMDRCSF